MTQVVKGQEAKRRLRDAEIEAKGRSRYKLVNLSLGDNKSWGKGQTQKSQRMRGRANSKEWAQSDQGTEELQQDEAAKAREQSAGWTPGLVGTQSGGPSKTCEL